MKKIIRPVVTVVLTVDARHEGDLETVIADVGKALSYVPELALRVRRFKAEQHFAEWEVAE